MSSAHCNCLPLAGSGVNYVPSGNKQKDTKMHKFLHPALLAFLSPQANTEENHPCKPLPSQQNAHLALDAGLWSWKETQGITP